MIIQLLDHLKLCQFDCSLDSIQYRSLTDMDKDKGKGARPKVSSSKPKQSKAKPKAKPSQPKPPENGKIQTKADIDKRSRSEFSARKTSYEDALPRDYRGPDGKPRTARPSPSSRTVDKSQDRSARSVTCDVSNCPAPRSGLNPKTRTPAPVTKLVPKISSESTEKTSIKAITR